MRSNQAGWLVVAALAAAGCFPDPDKLRASVVVTPDGGGGSGGGRDGGVVDAPGADTRTSTDAMGPSAACVAFAGKVCGRFADCSGPMLGYRFGSLAGCQARISLACSLYNGLPGSTWPSQACIDGYNTLSCDDFKNDRYPVECIGGGPLGEGQPCADDTQCQSAHCVLPATGKCGTCGKKTQAGDACDPDVRCPGYFRCSEAKTCVLGGRLMDACDAAHPCDYTLTCLAGKCALRGGAGSACTVAQDCDEFRGFLCDVQGTKTCVGFSTGPLCKKNPDGTYELCAAQGICQAATQTCMAGPALGQACDDTNGPYCSFPEICSAGKCQLPSPKTACGALPGGAELNGTAELSGGALGSGTTANTGLRKALAVKLLKTSTPFEVGAALAFGPGPSVYWAVPITNRGMRFECGVTADNLVLRSAAGTVLSMTDFDNVEGTMGEVGGVWTRTCLLPGQTGWVLGIETTLPAGTTDLFAAVTTVELSVSSVDAGKPLAARVLPTGYTTAMGGLQVAFKNVGTGPVSIPAAADNFSKFMIVDATGPIRWGFVADTVAPSGLLAAGATGTLGKDTFSFAGSAMRLQAWVDFDNPVKMVRVQDDAADRVARVMRAREQQARARDALERRAMAAR